MTAKVSKKNSFSTLSYQVLWLGSGIRPPRTIPLGPDNNDVPRSFFDYNVTIDTEKLPQGVTIEEMI